MPSYSDERREAVVAKLLPPGNRSVREVALPEGISEPTVNKWRKEAQEQGRCLPSAWTRRLVHCAHQVCRRR